MLGDSESIHFREHPIEDDEIRSVGVELRHRFLPVIGDHDLEVGGLQIGSHRLYDPRFVINNKNSRGHENSVSIGDVAVWVYVARLP